MLKRQHAGKRAWFIERNEHGRWTLRGGYPKAMMREQPDLRQMDIGGQSASKEELLRQEGDKIIIDGIHIVRS
jgi:hypothetical protein